MVLKLCENAGAIAPHRLSRVTYYLIIQLLGRKV